MGAYDGRSHKTDENLTPREPLLKESNEEPFIQSDGASSMYLKEPIVSSQNLSHEETPQASLLHQSYAAASQKGWLPEILAFTLALVALSAIIITLAFHNGSTLPHWPFQISINALISVFGVILKGTMLVPVAEGMCTSSPRLSQITNYRVCSHQSTEIRLVHGPQPANSSFKVRPGKSWTMGCNQTHAVSTWTTHSMSWCSNNYPSNGEWPVYPTGPQVQPMSRGCCWFAGFNFEN
jgi:hypothetical protein